MMAINNESEAVQTLDEKLIIWVYPCPTNRMEGFDKGPYTKNEEIR